MNDNEIKLKLQELDSLQSPCINCGLCLEVCSTYQATGWEHESPRGRIRLAKLLLEGEIHPSSQALQSFDRCLGCRACEKVCPTRVQYHSIRKIVMHLRRTLDEEYKNRRNSRFRLAYRISDRFWRAFGWKLLKFDPLKLAKPDRSFIYKNKSLKSPDAITLIVGCFQDVFQHDLIEQTIYLLRKLGIEVYLDPGQACCGAIFERVNDTSKALQHQEKCIEKFKNNFCEKAIFLSAGCRSFILGQGLAREKIVDLYALVLQRIDCLNINLKLDRPLTVYYQPYCSSGGEDPALKLLKRIEGIKILTLWPSKSCCGGFCGEAIFRPEQASFLRDSKWKSLPRNATVVVTSPDCWMQLKQIEGLQVLYPIQLLPESIMFRK